MASLKFIDSTELQNDSTLNIIQNKVLQIAQITEKYLQDQKSLTLIHDNENFVNDVMRLLCPYKTVYIYDYVNQSLVDRISDMSGNELVQPRCTMAYLRFAKNQSSLMENLNYFAHISTNGKWIFYVRLNSLDEAKEVLTRAWKEHKMSNIILFYDHQNLNLTVTFYNPFDRSLSVIGRFWDYEIRSENTAGIYKMIDEMFHKRYGKKLINYQMSKVFAEEAFGSEKYFLDQRVSSDIMDHVFKHKMRVIEASFKIIREKNGSLPSFFKIIEDGKADIGLSNRLVVIYGLNKSTFLNPIDSAKFMFVVKRHPDVAPRIYFHVTGAFDVKFIILYFFMLCLIVTIMRAQNSRFDLTSMILQTIGVTSSVSVPMTRHIKTHQQITFCSLLIFSVIVCGAYQGCIVKKLRSGGKFKEMSTLQELVDSNYNLIVLSSLTRPFKAVNGAYISNMYEQLDKRSTSISTIDEDIIPKITAMSDYAFLSNIINLNG